MYSLSNTFDLVMRTHYENYCLNSSFLENFFQILLTNFTMFSTLSTDILVEIQII